MTRTFLLLSLVLAVSMSFSQDSKRTPDHVSDAVYFDTSPPLRDMPIILPGERDRSWKDGIIRNQTMEDLKNRPAKEVPEGFVDPVLQTEYPAPSRSGNRGIGVNIDGVGNVNGVHPPDTDGDVGPDHYFQMINLSFAIYDKMGNQLYGPVDNSTLWSGFIGPWTGTNDGDPIVVYDEMADRWMASQFAINTNNGTYWQLVAVSATSDPMGAYHRYAFQMVAFNDYPKLSVWPDGYYATFNMFGGTTRAAVAAFERDSMLVGAPAQMVYFDMWGNFSMLSADVDGPVPPAGAPCYFAHLDTWGSGDLEIYEFTTDWSNISNSSIVQVSTLTTAPFNSNLDGVSQPNTGTKLDALSSMLMFRLQYRNFGTHESLVTNHTVNAGGRAGIRWYELRKDTGGWYIYQQSTYSPDAEGRWMASAAIAGNGTLALGFSKSSSSTYPSVYYVGRSVDAPLGTMNYPEVRAAEGQSSQSGVTRWGDYSCLSVDPVDDTTFWFTTEYTGSSWTRITSFDFGPFLQPEIDAGTDYCVENKIFETEPTYYAAESAFWETSGDGFFFNPDDFSAAYMRGAGDIDAGQVTLYVTAFGYNGAGTSTDSLILYIAGAAEVFAGNDTLICHDELLQLNGVAENYDSLIWVTNGDGTFDNDQALNAIYSPGPDDIAEGDVQLTLIAYDQAPCIGDDTDKLIVTIETCTGLDENPAKEFSLSVLPNPTKGMVTFSIDDIPDNDVLVLYLSDASGNILFTQRVPSNGAQYSNQMNLSYFPQGTYILKVEGQRFSATQKIILNK